MSYYIPLMIDCKGRSDIHRIPFFAAFVCARFPDGMPVRAVDSRQSGSEKSSILRSGVWFCNRSRRVKTGRNVVSAGEQHVFRNPQPAFQQTALDGDRGIVVAADDCVRPPLQDLRRDGRNLFPRQIAGKNPVFRSFRSGEEPCAALLMAVAVFAEQPRQAAGAEFPATPGQQSDRPFLLYRNRGVTVQPIGQKQERQSGFAQLFETGTILVRPPDDQRVDLVSPKDVEVLFRVDETAIVQERQTTVSGLEKFAADGKQRAGEVFVVDHFAAGEESDRAGLAGKKTGGVDAGLIADFPAIVEDPAPRFFTDFDRTFPPRQHPGYRGRGTGQLSGDLPDIDRLVHRNLPFPAAIIPEKNTPQRLTFQMLFGIILA